MRAINKQFLYIALTLILCLIAVACGRCLTFAYAVTYSNSDVLDDLQKDSSFNILDYPPKVNDYSINVIQIAEGADGNLYLYTYQPCQTTKSLVATDINMSLNSTVDGTKLYSLTLINTNSVFAKYLVNNIKLISAATRYYNITSVYRDWIEGVDEKAGNNNEIKEVAFVVGKLYKVERIKGETFYSCEKRDVVEITDKYVDFLRYDGGVYLWGGWREDIDSHYVAFDCNYNIDELYEADIYYVSRSASRNQTHTDSVKNGPLYTYGNSEKNYVFLTDEQTADVHAKQLWGKDRNYPRIEKVSDFISNEKLTDETKANLKGKQWVLRFVETDFTLSSGSLRIKEERTEVSEVSILRLHFKSKGTVYNLGVVDNKQSGDDKPGNPQGPELGDNDGENWWDKLLDFLANLWNKIKGIKWWQWLLIGVGIIAAIIIVLAIVKHSIKLAFKLIGMAVLWIFKAMWWIICLPFRGLKALFTKEDDKEGKEN